MPIELEWYRKESGTEVLLARKAKGKINIPELQEALRKDYRYQGHWGIIVKAPEESGYQGWHDSDDPKGDILELFKLEDWATCPICAEMFSGIEYCQHCGEKIKND